MTQPNAAPGSPLKAAIVRVTPFEQNCTLIWDEASKVGAVVDPGGDLERIEQAIKQTGISIEKILLTHGHIDHAGGADELREKLGVKIEGPHKNDVILLDNMSVAAVSQAVRMIKGRALVEVSGGITLKNVRAMASAGPDRISIGALTHSAPGAAMSLVLEPQTGRSGIKR